MKKIFLLFFVAIITSQAIYAQGGYGAATYSIGFPMGDLKNYTSDVSFRGANMEFYWHIKKDFDAGFEVGWNVFYSREDKATYTKGTESITGTQFRYTNAVPMIAGLRWRKTNGGNLQPFFGAGLGTTSVNRSTDFGLYRITNNTWQFCVRPEAGLIYKIADATGFTANVKYYANFKNNDLDAQSYLTVNVGFVFGLYHW